MLVSDVIGTESGEILELLYWILRSMDYLCTAHGVVHIRIGWHRLVPDHPFFNHVKDTVCQLPQVLLYHFTRYL